MKQDFFPEIDDRKELAPFIKTERKKVEKPSRQELKDLLIEHYGDVAKVAKCFKFQDGTEVSYHTVYTWIQKYKLDIVPKVIRTQVARSALDVLIEKCIYERDLKAAEMILKKWGKYIDFQEEKKHIEIEHSTNVWGKILEEVDPKRYKENLKVEIEAQVDE